MEINDTRQAIILFKDILIRRKTFIIICLLCTLIPALIYNEVAEPKYRARVSIIFEDQNNLGIVDTYSPLRTWQRETYIKNRVQEIRSRSLALQVAESLPDDLIELFRFPMDTMPEAAVIQVAAWKVMESIEVEPVNQTDVINIFVETHDPYLSQQLANKTASVLSKRNTNLKQEEVSGLREFIETQVKLFQKKLEDAERELKDFKEKNRITSLERESSELLARVTAAEVLYNQKKSERKSTEERLKVIKNKLSQNKQLLVPTITDVISPSLTRLKEKLVELNVQYTQLQVQDYSDDHPKLIELRRQIDETKNNLVKESLKLSQNENVVDPLSQIQEQGTQLVTLEIEYEALKSQEKALESVLREYESKLENLPSQELKLASLMRTKEVNEKLFLMLMQKREEAKISEADKSEAVRVIDYAAFPGAPVKPRKLINLILGFMLGSCLGLGLGFFKEYMNKNIRSAEQIEKLTGWQVLGLIPSFEQVYKLKLDKNKRTKIEHSKNSTDNPYIIGNENPLIAEAFRILRTNVEFLKSKQKFKSLLLTSIGAGEGKSTIAAKLAKYMTRLGLKVLIIDGDLRRPNVHRQFKIDKEPGLTDVLLNHHTTVKNLISNDFEMKYQDDAKESALLGAFQALKTHAKDTMLLEENYKEFEFSKYASNGTTLPEKFQFRNLINTSLIESLQSSENPNLKILTSGKLIEHPSELLSTFSMKLIIEEVQSKYDLVIIDCPPLMLVPDTMIMSSMVDGVAVVVEYDRNEEKMLLDVKKFFKKMEIQPIGAVLNKVDPKVIYKNNNYYYYY